MPSPARRASSSARTQTTRTVQDATSDLNKSVDAFRRILRALRLAARKTELATGLSAAQTFVLSAIGDAPGCSVNDIAEATMTDRSSAAAIVDRLVEQGYVTREQSGEDRRRAAIALTARGRRMKKDSAPAPTSLLIEALKQMSSAELRGLSDGLGSLTEAMGIANEPAGMLFEDSRPAGARSRRGSASK
jgi:MarR family transcriptional regulator, lower aerobic nicotinate degradation pathway regulator